MEGAGAGGGDARAREAGGGPCAGIASKVGSLSSPTPSSLSPCAATFVEENKSGDDEGRGQVG